MEAPKIGASASRKFYCTGLRNRRKSLETKSKAWIYARLRALRLKLANREFGGRYGDPAMTICAHTIAMSEAIASLRAHTPAGRPSLDLPSARLLLLSCP